MTGHGAAGVDGGAGEWRTHWPLAASAAIGFSVTGLHTFTIGAMAAPLQQAFGWSRAETTIGMTVSGLVGAALSIPVGLLVDRIGSRTVGLAGVAMTTASFGLLGTATGGHANWLLLWLLFAVASLGLQATVWTRAIAASFHRARGLALAVTLSGGSLAALVMPVLATWLIARVGWRSTFMAMALIWAAAALPAMLVGFRSGADRAGGGARADPAAAGIGIGAALRTATFYKLLTATGLFTFTVLGTIVHFVPILIERGATPLSAAAIASLAGLFSIVGRLGTGVLLDRFPGNLVGAAVFLLPIGGCAFLLADGGATWAQAAAAAGIGLTLGAETDVIAYLAAYHFGVRHLGVLFGALTGALALGTALGPLAASTMFDASGSYAPYLGLIVGLLAISFAALATLPRRPLHQTHGVDEQRGS